MRSEQFKDEWAHVAWSTNSIHREDGSWLSAFSQSRNISWAQYLFLIFFKERNRGTAYLGTSGNGIDHQKSIT